LSAQPEIPPVVVIEPTTSGENTVAVATPVDPPTGATTIASLLCCVTRVPFLLSLAM